MEADKDQNGEGGSNEPSPSSEPSGGLSPEATPAEARPVEETPVSAPADAGAQSSDGSETAETTATAETSEDAGSEELSPAEAGPSEEYIESSAPDDEADEPESEDDSESAREAVDEDPEHESDPDPTGTHAELGSLELPPGEDTPRDPPLRSRKHHVAPALIALERVDDDRFFQLRPEGDLSLLATDLARLGQLFPVDLRLVPPDRFQVVCGFRRVEALRFLQRDRVLARLHTDLSDEDALLMALADAIHYVPVSREELEALRKQLESDNRLGSEARDMLDKALTEGEELAPETVDEEVDADELAAKVATQLGDINQDLALLADVFASLDSEMKETLLQQLRYSSELVAFLENKDR